MVVGFVYSPIGNPVAALGGSGRREEKNGCSLRAGNKAAATRR